MSRSWEELERLKKDAIENDQIKHALFWQNEQILFTLRSVTWNLKLLNDGKSNV